MNEAATREGLGEAPTQNALLTTKLTIPPARRNTLPRRRLLECLDEGTAGALTLVAAPPGSGKTTLLATWARQSGRAVAWVSLDAGDNEPARFWGYVSRALDPHRPGVADAVQPLLHASQPPPLESVLVVLINALADRREDVVLVLDDYHLIASRAIHEELTFLIEHLPPHVHLVIAGRADPPIPLSRLRTRGLLTEIRAADLRFTSEEAATFLNEVMELGLAPQDIAALEARTEGWIAALHLAALSMRGRGDTSAFIAALTGSHRYILDYLSEEVLGYQPVDLQQFLLETSILDRLTGPLCDAVTGRRDGQMTLEALERANLFIVPLDEERHWYRYHRLFADFLRNRLHRQQPERVAELHRRAAGWYEQAGMAPEAIGHVLAAGDFVWGARLIERAAETMWTRGELGTLLHWLDALPDDVVRSRPRLLLIYAWAALLADDFAAAERRLEQAEQARAIEEFTPDVPGVIAAMRAALGSMVETDARGIIALGRQALAALPEDYKVWRSIAEMAMGLAYDSLGEPAPAAQALSSALADGLSAGDGFLAGLALWNLVRVRMIQGRLREPLRRCEELLDTDAGRPAQHAPNVGYVEVSLGRLLYERNDLDGAARHLEAGIAHLEQGGIPRPLLSGYVALARLRQARGDREEAVALMERAAQLLEAQGISGRLALLAPYRARLDLMHRNVAAAERHVLTGAHVSFEAEPAYAHEVEHLTLARLRLAQGRSQEAIQLLRWLGQGAEQAGRMGSLIEILVLAALAYRSSGNGEQAAQALERALSPAEPEGYIRVFVDEDGPMWELLTEALPQLSPELEAYARLLLAAFEPTVAPAAGPTPQPLVEPLSEREREVLQHLATGASNQQIADELVVTVRTVKKHASNIFGKLGVSNRTQAVARARDLGLL